MGGRFTADFGEINSYVRKTSLNETNNLLFVSRIFNINDQVVSSRAHLPYGHYNGRGKNLRAELLGLSPLAKTFLKAPLNAF